MNSKNKILLIGISLLVLCTFVGTASAIIYVDASNVGDPIEDGTIDHPFDKIQEGIDVANSEETVQVAAGKYYENVLLTTDGITLLGSGADVTVIDGKGEYNVVYAYEVTSFTIEGFTIRNSGHTGANPGSTGIHINPGYLQSGNFFIRKNVVQDNRVGISLWNILFGTTTIENNLISNNEGQGICNSGCGRTYILSNTIVHNGRSGYHDWVGKGPHTFTNNIIAFNEWYGINPHRDSRPRHISYNDVWSNSKGNYYEGYVGPPTPFTPSPGTGEISADPLFEDVASRDYHLSIGSPCVDAGTNVGAPSTDLDGNLRPIDGDEDGIAIVDMGAFEYNPESMTVKVNINPDTLNLQSNGEWITAYIELPEDYDVVDIDVSTILLENTVSAEANPTEIGDYDDDGIPDLMVKFDRSAVQDILEVGDEVEITVTGEVAGTQFGGSDTIRVIDKGKGK